MLGQVIFSCIILPVFINESLIYRQLTTSIFYMNVRYLAKKWNMTKITIKVTERAYDVLWKVCLGISLHYFKFSKNTLMQLFKLMQTKRMWLLLASSDMHD